MSSSAFSVLLLIIIASSSYVIGNPATSQAHTEIKNSTSDSEFKCSKAGTFPHPTKCSSYFYCDTKLIPSEKICRACNRHATLCPEGRLYYNSRTQQCTTADKVICPHPTKPTTIPTTAAPITATPTTPTTTKPTTTTPTTTTPTTTTPATTATLSTTPFPSAGECILDCKQNGTCACYDMCVPDNSSSTGGRWSKQYCNDTLFWNPDKGTQHGGLCDFWENLSDAVKDQYRNDTDCPGTPGLPCHWREDSNCDNRYFYLPENSKNLSFEENLECSKSASGASLYWNQDTKTCQLDCRKPAPCTVC